MRDNSLAPHGHWWCRVGRISLLFNRRACWLGLALSLGWLAAALLALSHGTLALSYPGYWQPSLVRAPLSIPC
jgi:hypothetical protein